MNNLEGAIRMENSTVTSNLVAPNCVQNRTFSVHCQTAEGRVKFLIKELLSKHDAKGGDPWKQHNPCLCDIDRNRYGRIIGRVNVIGCHDDHVVLQAIFNGQQGISFIYANLSTGDTHIIPTEIQYFPWNVVYKGNVQCFLSPDLSCAVFGLPHNYMSPVKNFKLLLSDICSTGNNLKFQGIRDTRFSLKKYKMIGFDPRKPHHVTLVHINPYCYKCSLEIWDLKDNVCVMCKKIIRAGSSTIIPVSRNPMENVLLRTAEHSIDIQLLQTHMTYSRAGKYLIISCLGVLSDFLAPQVRIIILDSDSFQVVKNVCFLLESDQALPNMFVSSLDNADAKVILWSYIREKPPQQIGEVYLPPDVSLQGMCKRTILAHCTSIHVDKLPLPQELIRKLQFKFLH